MVNALGEAEARGKTQAGPQEEECLGFFALRALKSGDFKRGPGGGSQ